MNDVALQILGSLFLLGAAYDYYLRLLRGKDRKPWYIFMSIVCVVALIVFAVVHLR